MLTPEEIATIEEENEIYEVLRWEEEMQKSGRVIPFRPEDGLEIESRERRPDAEIQDTFPD